MAVVKCWEVQKGKRVRDVRSEGGKEYTGKSWPRWLTKKGLQHQTTTRYTLQSNGVAERQNQVVVELMMAELHESGLKRKCWAVAAVTVNDLGNRVVGRQQSVAPYELFHGVRPDVGPLRLFGCRAWVQESSALRVQTSPRALESTFVGYGNTRRASVFFCTERRKRAVTFAFPSRPTPSWPTRAHTRQRPGCLRRPITSISLPRSILSASTTLKPSKHQWGCYSPTRWAGQRRRRLPHPLMLPSRLLAFWPPPLTPTPPRPTSWTAAT